jgi:hypothetical protein
MDTTNTTFVLAACFGSFCQEVLYWFELRKKLGEEENQKLLKSGYYWTITILVVVVSGYYFTTIHPLSLKFPLC